MECKHAQSLIPQYLMDRLSLGELEEFIRHVEKCPECYEELETYFMLNRALKFLDEGDGTSYNLKSLLEKDLRAKKHRLSVYRQRHRIWLAFCAFSIVALVLACLDLGGLLKIPYLSL